MILARLLALLGLLLLTPVAQAAPGSAAVPGLLDIEALIEAPARLNQTLEADGPEALTQQTLHETGLPRPSPRQVLSTQAVACTRHIVAQPRAPPFSKV